MLLFILGLFIGANFSFFLYACILVGKKSDTYFNEKEEQSG